jgi:hypothetical protein
MVETAIVAGIGGPSTATRNDDAPCNRAKKAPNFINNVFCSKNLDIFFQVNAGCRVGRGSAVGNVGGVGLDRGRPS